jgi:hypothetical protein
MPKSNWLPTVVPYGADQTVYLVFDSFGASRSDCPEKEIERDDLETTISDLLTGQFNSALANCNAPRIYPRGVPWSGNLELPHGYNVRGRIPHGSHRHGQRTALPRSLGRMSSLDEISAE